MHKKDALNGVRSGRKIIRSDCRVRINQRVEKYGLAYINASALRHLLVEYRQSFSKMGLRIKKSPDSFLQGKGKQYAF